MHNILKKTQWKKNLFFLQYTRLSYFSRHSREKSLFCSLFLCELWMLCLTNLLKLIMRVDTGNSTLKRCHTPSSECHLKWQFTRLLFWGGVMFCTQMVNLSLNASGVVSSDSDFENRCCLLNSAKAHNPSAHMYTRHLSQPLQTSSRSVTVRGHNKFA